MVRGLDLFRDHFRGLADRYVLIGGTACDLIMDEAGLRFRATQDLDIVLCIESLDAEFARTFWAFVKAGGYRHQETAEGKRRFYREDMRSFLDQMATETVDLKALGLKTVSVGDVLDGLRMLYRAAAG